MRRFAWQSMFLLVAVLVGCNGASGPTYLSQGEEALDKKQYDEAITLLTKAASHMPKSAEAYNYLGAAYQGKGDQSKAVQAFERSIDIDPHYPPPRFNLGVVFCVERQQYDKAIEQLNVFVALQPNNIDGYFYLASAQFQAGDLRNAYTNYLRVVEGDPNRPEVLNNLGVITAKLGQTHEAETWFNSCIKTDPKYSPAYLNIAILDHHTLNKPAAALDYYQKFLDLEPAGPSSDNARKAVAELKSTGTAATETKPVATVPIETAAPAPVVTEAQKTATATTARAEISPTRTEARPTDTAKAAATQPPAAGVTTNRAQATAPAAPAFPGPRWPAKTLPKPVPGKRDAALAQFNQGAQSQKDHMLDAAISRYREAVRLDPTLTAAYYNLGTALQAENMPNQAIDAYQQALNLQPAFVNARLNLGILFESQGYRADAVDQYEAVVHEAPNDAVAHFALGRLYATQPSLRPKARQHYQRYLELAPNAAQAKDVRRWLQANR